MKSEIKAALDWSKSRRNEAATRTIGDALAEGYQALIPFARHLPTCGRWAFPPKACSCGLAELIEDESEIQEPARRDDEFLSQALNEGDGRYKP